MTDHSYRKPLLNKGSALKKWFGSEVLLVIFLVIFIGFFQAFYFKTQFFLRQGGDYNLITAVLSSDGLFSLAVTSVVVGLHFLTAAGLKRIFNEQRVKVRYLVQFILSALFSAGGASLCMWFYYTVLYDFNMPSADVIFNTCVLAIIIPIILNGLLETFYYRSAWLKEQYNQAQINRQMVAAKFDALKNQLSPHFVFNGFNTLSAIIEKDPIQAQAFLEELSHVYRYILDNKDKETVRLNEELDSLKALLSVQETRHPGAVKININISDKYLDNRIIPLTLHTLVENVFKHNSLSPVTPIELTMNVNDNDILIIENDIRPKLDVQSHNIGIDNLSRRYELLLDKKINIEAGKNIFSVEIPLIHQEAMST